MNKFAIIADASCDLGEKYQKEYDIRIVYGHVNYPEVGEKPTYLKWDTAERDKFYKELSKNPDGYATAPPNIDEFRNAFEEYAAKGEDVICITISGGISGAFNFAVQAKNEVLKKYPNARISVIDSLRFSIGHGLLVILAAKLRANGRSIGQQEPHSPVRLARRPQLRSQEGQTDPLQGVLRQVGRRKAHRRV